MVDAGNLNSLNNANIDLGEVSSRDLGNTTKSLVDIGKEAVVQNAATNQDVDYGNLPSRLLPDLGKQALAQQVLIQQAVEKSNNYTQQ